MKGCRLVRLFVAPSITDTSVMLGELWKKIVKSYLVYTSKLFSISTHLRRASAKLAFSLSKAIYINRPSCSEVGRMMCSCEDNVIRISSIFT